MPANLNPEDYGLPNLPLRPVSGKPKHCDDCRELVTEQRWSPYWCPDHDLLRIKRIDNNLMKFAAGYNINSNDL